MISPSPFDKVSIALNEIPDWARSKSNHDFLMAFRRLVRNEPKRVKKGSPVNQRQVALEAGKTAAALKPSRHKEIIELIKAFNLQNSDRSTFPKLKKDQLAAKNKTINELKNKIAALTMERDEAQSKVTSLSLDLLMQRKLINDLNDALDKANGQKTSASSSRVDFSPRP
jgi:chromosome segregation ATPase